MINDDLQGLLNKAYFYLKFRPRTVAEMRRYLYKKIIKTHWSRADADKVIDYLIDRKLLDDQQFISLFVEERKTLKPKGRFVLEQELLRHGIYKDLIDNYFDDNPVDEVFLAKKTLEKYWQRFKNLAPDKRFKKASQFLLRRGFGYDVVRKTIEEIL